MCAARGAGDRKIDASLPDDPGLQWAAMPPPRILCDLCDRPVSPHGHYIVRIDIFADPAMPAVTAEEMEEADYQQAVRELMEQMKHLSADDLQDQVARQFEFKLCRPCQMRFLANPLGKPRLRRVGAN
jgi:hypothetical protein